MYYHGLDLLGKRKIYDTLQIAKKILKRHSEYDEDRAIDRDAEYDYDVYDYKLDTLCEYYGIATANLHQSVYDCIATADLFENMVDDILDR